MNRKQLTILLAVGAVVIGLGLMVYKKDTSAWKSSGQSMGQKALGEFQVDDVSHVTIRHETNEINLIRKDDKWQVKERYDYPANFVEIGDFLRKLWDLKTVQTLKVGPSQLGRLELEAPGKGTNSATLVELKDASGKIVKSVLLGKKHVKKASEAAAAMGGGGDWPDGRYLMVQNGGQDVSLVADPLTSAEPKPETWINKDFVKVEKVQSVSVAHATNNWRIFRDTDGGELKLADAKSGEQFDPAKASVVGNVLSFPSFADVVSPSSNPEQTGLANPVVANVTTFDGFSYEVKIGSKTADENYHVSIAVNAELPKERTPGKDEKPEDKERLDKEFKEKLEKQKEKLAKEKAIGKWTYLVSKWTIDAFLKDRASFMADKKEEAKEGGPASSIPAAPALPFPPTPNPGQ